MITPLCFDHGFSKASPNGNYMLDGFTPKEEAEEVLEGLCQECGQPINNNNRKFCDECLASDERGERGKEFFVQQHRMTVDNINEMLGVGKLYEHLLYRMNEISSYDMKMKYLDMLKTSYEEVTKNIEVPNENRS